ncbi:hypothetical protein V6N12_047050 [Hibiscus sabdariffa]|uniref:Uncharacterized protein n=1 Tax=Hibiscus sabdariffa TaxID=183260 RepID=A0ABR2ANN2_9ROSI
MCIRATYAGSIEVKATSLRNLDEETHLSKEDLRATGEAVCASGKVDVIGKVGVTALKRIKGHVDDELLWKCSRCLVGTMVVFSNSEAIMDCLNSWGLGDIKVKHIGGYQYLIEIRDIELFKMLEDLQWSRKFSSMYSLGQRLLNRKSE